MNHWIDTHAHIYLEQFAADRDEMLRRSNEAGVAKIYMPNIDHTSIDDMLEVELRYPQQCIAMMGLHPCSVKKDFERELYIVEEWLRKRSFAAIGEIGTDLYWDKTFWEQQKEAFKIQVSWAKEFDLPIVIHCRDSMEETISLVENEQNGNLKGIFHCFTGTIEQAKRINELGFFLGIGGVSTFKKGGLEKVIPDLDLNYVVLETDSPYLSPVPHRGRRNEPAYVPLIADKIVQLTEIGLEELQTKTTDNAVSLFKK